MATYLILNCVFIALLGAAYYLLKPRVPRNVLVATLGVLLVFTAIFDSLAISLGMFYYDTAKLLGIYIGSAPVEDFFYALLAGAMIPGIWTLLKERDERKK